MEEKKILEQLEASFEKIERELQKAKEQMFYIRQIILNHADDKLNTKPSKTIFN
jgi:hypothetical protein